jgi:hypothetical protein
MKLLIVTAIHECKEAVAHIFHETGLHKYSVIDIHGVNNIHAGNMLDNWFASPGTDDFNEAVMMFCFTEDAAARKTLAALKQYNIDNCNDFPVRALLMPVEESI